jgi:hypothetical protein
MASRHKRMTMEQAITILRASGWKVDVDEVEKKISLQDPSPDVKWLHLLRKQGVAESEPRD